MFCKQCGQEQAQGIKFCANCGAPMEDAQKTGGDKAAVAVKTAAQAPAAGQEPILTGKGKGIAVLAIGAVVVVIAAVLLIKLLGGLIGGGGAKPMVAFARNDGSELLFRGNLKEKTDAVAVTDETVYDAQFSADGKQLYYRESAGLYVVKTPVTEKSKPQRIARDVSSFWLLETGKVAFRDADGYQVYEGKDSYELLDSGDGDFSGFSRDGKSFYYRETDSQGRQTLYKKEVKKDAKAAKVVEDFYELYSSYDADVLVYAGKRNDDGTVDVYSCKPGEKGAKLVGDVGNVWMGAEGSAQFYYTVARESEVTLYDLVDDDMLSQDQATLSGEEPVYPNSDDFDMIECGPAGDREAYYITPQGERITVEWDPDYYGDPMDVCWVDISRRYDEARALYAEANEKWQDAKRRESAREELKGETYGRTTYDLYDYNGKVSETPVVSGLGERNMNGAKDGVLIYRKEEQKSVGKVAKMSELSVYYQRDAIYDVRDRLEDDGVSRDNAWYVYVGGKESELDVRSDSSINGVYVLEGKEVVLDLYEKGEKSMRAYAIQGQALEELGELSSKNYRLATAYSNEYTEVKADQPLYFYEGESTTDFMSYAAGDQGQAKTVVENAEDVCLLEDGSVYAMTGGYELSRVKNGDAEEVLDDVGSVYKVTFLGGGKLLYISDSNDLMYYNGKESVRLEKDVDWYISPPVGQKAMLYTKNS